MLCAAVSKHAWKMVETQRLCRPSHPHMHIGGRRLFGVEVCRTDFKAQEDADMKQRSSTEVRKALSFGLIAVLVVAVVRTASAQMLEGTLSGTFAAFGTLEPKTTGKERTVLAIDEDGLSVTNGVLDHMTWHCSGLVELTNGMGQTEGSCAGHDPLEIRSSSTLSRRSTRRARRLCTVPSVGQAAAENTPGSGATDRTWITPENSNP
jgi:hypothetical protein